MKTILITILLLLTFRGFTQNTHQDSIVSSEYFSNHQTWYIGYSFLGAGVLGIAYSGFTLDRYDISTTLSICYVSGIITYSGCLILLGKENYQPPLNFGLRRKPLNHNLSLSLKPTGILLHF